MIHINEIFRVQCDECLATEEFRIRLKAVDWQLQHQCKRPDYVEELYNDNGGITAPSSKGS